MRARRQQSAKPSSNPKPIFGISFCDFCVTSAPSAFAPVLLQPKQSQAAKTPITSLHAPSQPFTPHNPHKHWFKPFLTNLVFLLRLQRNLCDFCVRPRIPPHSFHPKPKKITPQQRKAPQQAQNRSFCPSSKPCQKLYTLPLPRSPTAAAAVAKSRLPFCKASWPACLRASSRLRCWWAQNHLTMQPSTKSTPPKHWLPPPTFSPP